MSTKVMYEVKIRLVQKESYNTKEVAEVTVSAPITATPQEIADSLLPNLTAMRGHVERFWPAALIPPVEPTEGTPVGASLDDFPF